MCNGYAEFRYVTTSVYQSGASANPIISELPFTSENFTQQLNSIGTFQGEVLLSGLKHLLTNVYNGTIPDQRFYGFFILTHILSPAFLYGRELFGIESTNSENQRLHITSQEMLSLYQRRRISDTKVYTSKDPTFIAKDLMQYTEAKYLR
jgi:hypothetical protein